MPADRSAQRADDAPTPCALCGIGGQGTELILDGSPVTVAYVTDDLVAVVACDGASVLLTSRSHGDRLTAEPREAGIVLGALRRAAAEVATAMGASDYRVEPGDVPEAPGHIFYRVRAEPERTERTAIIDVARLTTALARSGPDVGPADRPRPPTPSTG